MGETVSVEREIAAPPEQVWAMVSDVERMGEWSPETVGCRWLGDAAGPAPGARFRGRNRRGGRRWSTECTVTQAEPGGIFAFESKAGPFRIARWSYRFEPTDDGCRVIEEWWDQRGTVIKALGTVISGVSDRAVHNRAGMHTTLERLATAAESAG